MVKGGSEFWLAIWAELQHTLVAEIGCVSKVIHFSSPECAPGQLRYSIAIFILLQEFHGDSGMLRFLQGGRAMDRAPTTSYFWISRLAGFVGIACMVLAVVTSVTHHYLRATPAEWVQIAIAAFVFAVWAVLYEIRDRGIRTSNEL